MEKSIAKTVASYASAQIVCMMLLSVFFSIPVTSFEVCVACSISLHVLLFFFLLKFKSSFINVSTGIRLDKINLANRITLLRISSLPTIALLLQNRDMSQIRLVLPILLALVFLTDSFDGQIARKKNQITKMGAMLDSISDYLLIGVISIVYLFNDIVPKWFFLLIIVRLFFQAVGMLVFILLKKPVEIRSTWGGKITIASTMTLYVLELIKLYLPTSTYHAFAIAEYSIGAIILALCFEKGVIFMRHGKDISHAKQENSAND
jgi:phosphatidylglycerophosphate synthase